MPKTRGYSLPELLICLLIGTLLLSLATPSLSSLLQNSRKTQQTNQLLGMLHYARGTAVLDKRTITLCSGTPQCSKSNSWHESLLVFADDNSNGIRDAGEALLQQASLDHNYRWIWSSFGQRSYVTYQRDGTTKALNGTFTLCHQGLALQQVVISLSGRARTQAPDTPACR